MEIIMIVIGFIIIGIIIAILSGPRNKVKRVESLQVITDQSLQQEWMRIGNWVTRYESLDKDWQKKSATDEAHNGYKKYFDEIRNETERRKFFYKIMDHFPSLKMMLPKLYGELLNDSAFNMAWEMSSKGTPFAEIVKWLNVEVYGNSSPATDTAPKEKMPKNITILLEVINKIPQAVIFNYDPGNHYLIGWLESLGFTHVKYTQVAFVASAAFCFTLITNRSIFSKSEEEVDCFLNTVCQFEEYSDVKVSKTFKNDCKNLIRKINEDLTRDPWRVVNSYFENFFPVQKNEEYETIHRYFNRNIEQIILPVNDAFLRAGYRQFV